MSQSAKTAIGSMVTALSVVIMIPTALDIFCYALPAIAGMLILFCVIEIGKNWAFGVFSATSIISLILVPNKEAAVLYACFFGYYPIVKALLESKVPVVAEYILKFAVFNVSVIAAYFIVINVLGMPLDELLDMGENDFLNKYALPIMLLLGNFAFITLDICMTRMVSAYLRVWQKKFRKMFPFK